MSILRSSLLLFSVLVCDTISALPPEVEAAMHKGIQILELDRAESIEKIWELRTDKKAFDILIARLPRSAISSEAIQVLTNWVGDGGALILRPNETDWLTEFEIKETRGLSEDAPVKRSSASHELLTGVAMVDFERYFKTLEAKEAIPLFASSRGVIAIAVNYGRGRIICTPDYATNRYDGGRFKVNEMAWLSGYLVPGSRLTGARRANPATSNRFDSIRLKNGDELSGQIKTATIDIKTSYASLSFSFEKISWIEFEGAGANIDRIQLCVGDTLSGVVSTANIEIKLSTGTIVTLAKDKIKSIAISSDAHPVQN